VVEEVVVVGFLIVVGLVIVGLLLGGRDD